MSVASLDPRIDLVWLVRDDGAPLATAVPLAAAVRPFLERLLGVPLADGAVAAVALPAAASVFPGEPATRWPYRTPELGLVFLLVVVGGRVVYRHTHTVREAVQPFLADWTVPDGAREAAGFAVWPAGVAPVLAAAPVAEAEGSGTFMRMRRIEDEPLPLRDAMEFAAAATDSAEPADADVRVVVPRSLYEQFTRTAQFSLQVESGGFLLGRAFRDAARPDGHIVELTDVVLAEHSGASLLHFTFTGDSFSAIQRRISGTGLRLLGWYHTHLFAATPRLGLSSIDVRMHHTTFRQAWQIAGLVNLEPDRDPDERALRFYARFGRSMALCPLAVSA